MKQQQIVSDPSRLFRGVEDIDGRITQHSRYGLTKSAVGWLTMEVSRQGQCTGIHCARAVVVIPWLPCSVFRDTRSL